MLLIESITIALSDKTLIEMNGAKILKVLEQPEFRNVIGVEVGEKALQLLGYNEDTTPGISVGCFCSNPYSTKLGVESSHGKLRIRVGGISSIFEQKLTQELLNNSKVVLLGTCSYKEKGDLEYNLNIEEKDKELRLSELLSLIKLSNNNINDLIQIRLNMNKLDNRSKLAVGIMFMPDSEALATIQFGWSLIGKQETAMN